MSNSPTTICVQEINVIYGGFRYRVHLCLLRLWGTAASAAEQCDILRRLLLRTCQHVRPCQPQRNPGRVLQWHPSCDQHTTRWHWGLMARQPGSPLSAAGPAEWNCAQLLQVGTLIESKTVGGRISSVSASMSRKWELSECLKVKLNQCSQCLKVEIGNDFLITQGTATSDSSNWRHELSKKEVSKGEFKLKFCQSVWPHLKCQCELIPGIIQLILPVLAFSSPE